MSDMIEKVARAIHAVEYPREQFPEDPADEWRQSFMLQAQAALTAYEPHLIENGLVVVTAASPDPNEYHCCRASMEAAQREAELAKKG